VPGPARHKPARLEHAERHALHRAIQYTCI
jgi:hypothetical protein